MLAATGSKGITWVLDKLHDHSDHMLNWKKAQEACIKATVADTESYAVNRLTNQQKNSRCFLSIESLDPQLTFRVETACSLGSNESMIDSTLT